MIFEKPSGLEVPDITTSAANPYILCHCQNHLKRFIYFEEYVMDS